MQTRQLRLAPTLSDVQRWALKLAEAHGGGVLAVAKDGSLMWLRRGSPRRALVIYLCEEDAQREVAD